MHVPQPRMKKGYWYIRINGHDYYLGKDREEADRKANDLISELIPESERLIPFSEIVGRWLETMRDVLQPRTFYAYRCNVKTVLRTIGSVCLGQFTKLRYIEALNRFAADGKARETIKAYQYIILESLKYAEIRDMVPAGTYATFKIIPVPRNARPPRKIVPMRMEALNAVRGLIGETIYDILHLEILTGMRPCELLRLRAGDIIELSSGVWQYVIYQHKTSARTGEPLIKYIGPKAQEILNRYIAPDEPDKPLFITRSGKPYTTDDIAQRICRLKKAFPGRFPAQFHQYQCRHRAGTEARKCEGLEGAQAFLGHQRRSTSEIYAETNSDLAVAVALSIG